MLSVVNFLKSEIVRSMSGLAMLGIASFVILIPLTMINVGPSLDGLREIDDVLATRILFGLIASSAIAAMYLGSYAFSREYYYRSISRSLVMASPGRVFAAKIIASALANVGICLIGMVVWTGVTITVLHSYGKELQVNGAFWAIVAGSLFAVVCCGTIGVALGRIVKNYYAVTGVVILVPLMIELPLLLDAPAFERFLPMGAVAGLAQLPVTGLLPWWGSALVLVGWSLVATGAAVVVLRRSEE
ncbi:ABC transporter permease [Rathayibacter toxicus]|nr:hypothetical protein TI83_01730 [Rathayibacter toxicus]PPH68610.1 ABC transporter permease [Rathayibacter toxicus]PPH82784.1 ABC transporter permease [Rathayibacter toxicus]PPH93307.1 ABC transporter permease [Rathayibacter toxicus]PPI54472.1 ABC transporter permease [Rathayibacter toxicus]